ncbi:hypothetical protein HL666_33180 [Bradyrhizobium sp. 83002]|uniref:hypothetical protein n=1 Tax=Bradyrhizobium aeschynomenes TaxID=2734909 RepID=UPI001556B652|nr:hypothetical protein [Bradyrhizobium aeschynomenes]NPU15626.1 hypothetical protein [Bradyrhizobium aeschynomenes]
MSVIPFCASARQHLQSRTGAFHTDLAAVDEDGACLRALAVSRLIAATALPLAGQTHARMLHLMT